VERGGGDVVMVGAGVAATGDEAATGRAGTPVDADDELYSRRSPATSAKSLLSNTAQPTLTPPVARRQETQGHTIRATGLPVTR